MRERDEPDSDHRTPFQRDRDRIVHSKAFRRLKHKTQVFIAPEGDHYRTRLTHTLEACGIARNVARALGLNEDLTEAIGLGHDLGHPPFGHTGEAVLDECVRERWGRAFRHNEHSLRVVDRIERLNLTEPVRDGILRHTGPEPPATLEGRVVRIVDRIAYINHDIDDALRAGVLRFEDLPRDEIELLGATGSDRIETLVVDLLERSDGAGEIAQGEEVGGAMLRLREFMFERVYLAADAQREKPRIERMLRMLFDHYAASPPPPLTDGRVRRAARGRLACGDDRPLRHPRLLRPLPPAALLMGLFTRDSIDRLRDAIDMVDLVGAKTDLRRVGSRFTGLCPFHDERTPSFSVNAEEKLFYCFGCQAKGDAIGFVEQAEGLDFPEAVELLAERYGVRLEREDDDPRAEERRRRRARLHALLDAGGALLRHLPLGLARGGAGARATWPGAGWRSRCSGDFGVGYAPKAWDRMIVGAAQGGFSQPELVAAGLAAARSRGRPLRPLPRARSCSRSSDFRGQVLGFGARAMSESQQPEVPEHVRERRLPQGPPALRHRPRARGGGQERSDRGRGGLHRRARVASGGDPGVGGDHGHRAHAGAAGAARPGGPAGGARARRGSLRPGGDAARRAGEPGTCSCTWSRCRRDRIRPT